MVIGPHHYDYLAHVTLSGCGSSTLMWTSSIKYLGTDMTAGSSFDINFDQAMRYTYIRKILSTFIMKESYVSYIICLQVTIILLFIV